MHFWWCGFVCAHALIETKELKMKIRKKIAQGEGTFFNNFQQFVGR
jgi:hypothetical protein